MRRLLPFVLLLVLVGVSSPTRAAQPTVVSKRSPTVSWQGHLNGSAPLGCGNPSSGCDERDIVVDAARGSWVTIAADLENATIRVTSGGA